MYGQLFQIIISNELFISRLYFYIQEIPAMLLLTYPSYPFDLRLQNSMLLLLTTHAFSNLLTEILIFDYR